MKSIKRIALGSVLLAGLVVTNGCKKDVPSGPNDLGGETNIPLTEVGSTSSVYLTFNGNNLPGAEMTVTKRENGIVSYHVVMDLTNSPDSALFADLIPAEYQDEEGRIVGDFDFKITSDGIQDFFQSSKPWTVVKYDDPVGTQYPLTTDRGEELVRTVTEKTGEDDWPLGFFYIKTSKVEEENPPYMKEAAKVSYRANHRFGLVYIEVELKDGNTAAVEILPWHLL